MKVAFHLMKDNEETMGLDSEHLSDFGKIV